jgi:hypothetical protein
MPNLQKLKAKGVAALSRLNQDLRKAAAFDGNDDGGNGNTTTNRNAKKAGNGNGDGDAGKAGSNDDSDVVKHVNKSASDQAIVDRYLAVEPAAMTIQSIVVELSEAVSGLQLQLAESSRSYIQRSRAQESRAQESSNGGKSDGKSTQVVPSKVVLTSKQKLQILRQQAELEEALQFSEAVGHELDYSMSPAEVLALQVAWENQ